MSIEDEIRAKKEKMQADMREAERQKQEADRLATALRNAGMSYNSPILIAPASELQPVISEAMSSMKFTSPKIVRSMPDGRTLARVARTGQNGEKADMYSFDVQLFSTTEGKSTYRYYLWVFKNGAVSFSRNNADNMTWDNIRSNGIDSTVVRSKIIDTLAQQAVQNEKNDRVASPSSSSSQSGGCYIATAVYGSYDCPEVWVLRRYRDSVLQHNYFGRLFVKAYYTFSPTLVRFMGSKRWFVSFWRRFLDRTVTTLKTKGFSDQKYDDWS